MGFRLSRGLPLQQAFAGYEAANERANNGVDGEQCLVGKKEEVEQSDHRCLARTGESLLDATFLADDECAAHPEDNLDDGGEEEEKQQNNGPIHGTAGQDQPAGHEQD